jgi:hypothetical protein
METQLNRGLKRRLMYIENKDGEIDGAAARIGWAHSTARETHLFFTCFYQVIR